MYNIYTLKYVLVPCRVDYEPLHRAYATPEVSYVKVFLMQRFGEMKKKNSNLHTGQWHYFAVEKKKTNEE